MIRRVLFTVGLVVGWGIAPPLASAAPIVADQWYTFGFGGVGSALVSGAGFVLGTDPPGGGAVLSAPDTPWEITTTSNDKVLIVVDGFFSIDRFELFNFGSSIGFTSVPTPEGNCGSNISCALANPDFYSQATFALAVGSHSFTGLQTLGVAGAGFFVVTTRETVPEPATLVLLGAGLVGLTAARRRRRAA
jgi:hypothetical protein